MNSDAWLKFYEIAKKYYLKYGNLNVPYNYVTEDGDKLGSWIHVQRQAYKNHMKIRITEEQIELLNELGMVWDMQEYKWMLMYREAVRYYNEFQNLEVPTSYVTDSGEKLGSWVHVQRTFFNNNDGRLSDEQIDLLNKINMIWNVLDYRWNKFFYEAKKYYYKYGNLNVPVRYVTDSGVCLGSWILKQRQAYNNLIKARLTEDKIEKLNSINMNWKIDSRYSTRKLKK